MNYYRVIERLSSDLMNIGIFHIGTEAVVEMEEFGEINLFIIFNFSSVDLTVSMYFFVTIPFLFITMQHAYIHTHCSKPFVSVSLTSPWLTTITLLLMLVHSYQVSFTQRVTPLSSLLAYYPMSSTKLS